MENRIAVVLTCFNRKQLTLNCIDRLSNQSVGNSIDFYICDDLSTDGTYEAVRKQYPDVHIIRSNGNLYWCRGMFAAMQMAVKEKYEFYLMVNDDVAFDSDAVEKMLNVYYQKGGKCGVVGMTCLPESKEVSYGARNEKVLKLFGIPIFKRDGTEILKPTDSEIIECDLANWNCFLIDRLVLEKVGLLDPRYEHGFGDYDYSIRIRKAGFHIYVAPVPIGYCEDHTQERKVEKQTSKFKRLKKLFGPKGTPIRSTYLYAWKQSGITGVLFVTVRYIKLIITA